MVEVGPVGKDVEELETRVAVVGGHRKEQEVGELYQHLPVCALLDVALNVLVTWQVWRLAGLFLLALMPLSTLIKF